MTDLLDLASASSNDRRQIKKILRGELTSKPRQPQLARVLGFKEVRVRPKDLHTHRQTLTLQPPTSRTGRAGGEGLIRGQAAERRGTRLRGAAAWRGVWRCRGMPAEHRCDRQNG